MGLICKLLKTTIDIATLPVSVVTDTITMGGELTDREEPYTMQHLKAIGKDTIETIEEIEKI